MINMELDQSKFYKRNQEQNTCLEAFEVYVHISDLN